MSEFKVEHSFIYAQRFLLQCLSCSTYMHHLHKINHHIALVLQKCSLLPFITTDMSPLEKSIGLGSKVSLLYLYLGKYKPQLVDLSSYIKLYLNDLVLLLIAIY